MKEIITERVKVLSREMITNPQCDTLVLPDSIEVIGYCALASCTQLKEIIFVDEDGKEVNNKIQEIDPYAFAHTKIEKFIYSHHLKSIGYYAFYDTPLSIFQYQDDASLESSLKKIGSFAFKMTQMRDFVIPPSVEILSLDNCIRSVLCKDSKGRIVPGFHDLESNYYLEEISLIGASFLEI